LFDTICVKLFLFWR